MKGSINASSHFPKFLAPLVQAGARVDTGNPDSAIAISSYKTQTNPPAYSNNIGNIKTVPVTNFPNGRVTKMLQNSYSNGVSQSTYSRVNLNNHNELINNSFTRSKSVYKDQDWVRNGTSGTRSTASHSTSLPPAFKKNSSISADYGKNYQQSSYILKQQRTKCN